MEFLRWALSVCDQLLARIYYRYRNDQLSAHMYIQEITEYRHVPARMLVCGALYCQ